MASTIPRRDFLKSAALTTAALSLQSSLAFDEQLKRRGPAKKIIVIGAGLAGLCAAYELTQAGHVLIETCPDRKRENLPPAVQ